MAANVTNPLLGQPAKIIKTYETKIVKKTAVITLIMLAALAVIGIGAYEIAGSERSLSASHTVTDLLDKVVSSPAAFVVGASIFGALYVAVRLCRLRQNPQDTAKRREKTAERKEKFINRVMVTVIAFAVILIIAFAAKTGATNDATKDFFSKWDQPEVLAIGFVAAALLFGLDKWSSRVLKTKKVTYEVFETQAPSTHGYEPGAGGTTKSVECHSDEVESFPVTDLSDDNGAQPPSPPPP